MFNEKKKIKEQSIKSFIELSIYYQNYVYQVDLSTEYKSFDFVYYQLINDGSEDMSTNEIYYIQCYDFFLPKCILFIKNIV